jgi:hypothetical protein
MPLGVLWERDPIFKVYKNTGLYEILINEAPNKEFKLLLYSPVDPIDYYLSINHDKIIENEGPCKPPRPYMMYILCKPKPIKEEEVSNVYLCKNVEVFEGAAQPFTRVYGCLVEMLVVLTKLEAGALDESYIDYLRKLKWCIERASPRNDMFKEVAEDVLRRTKRAKRFP